eukprot:15428312-Alexandrium_andersonii.AAC.2
MRAFARTCGDIRASLNQECSPNTTHLVANQRMRPYQPEGAARVTVEGQTDAIFHPRRLYHQTLAIATA